MAIVCTMPHLLPLPRGFQVRLTFSIQDELGKAADLAASAEGLTRSRWITRLIERELADRPAPPSIPKRHRGDRKYLKLRVDAPVADAIDQVAIEIGMKRNQWIELMLYNHLFRDDGEVIFCPISAQGFGDAVIQLIRIGQNINHAARTMNVAALADNRSEITDAALRLSEMKQDVLEQISETRKSLLKLASAERSYWRRET